VVTKVSRKSPRKIIITGSRGSAKKKPTLVEKYQEMLKKKPMVPPDYLNPSLGKARDLVYDGWDLYSHDPRGARECFDEALELDPDLADAYNGLAGLAVDKKRFEEAEALYRTAYEKARAARSQGVPLVGGARDPCLYESSPWPGPASHEAGPVPRGRRRVQRPARAEPER
jgi:tetratricopeptide (TPR) repeat protein